MSLGKLSLGKYKVDSIWNNISTQNKVFSVILDKKCEYIKIKFLFLNSQTFSIEPITIFKLTCRDSDW